MSRHTKLTGRASADLVHPQKHLPIINNLGQTWKILAQTLWCTQVKMEQRNGNSNLRLSYLECTQV